VADTKISGLSAGAPAQATDLIPIARSGANFSITPANILAYGSSPVAGTTGTFSSTLAAGNTTITGTQTISGAVSSKSMLVVGSGGSTSAGWHLGNFSSGVSGLWSTTITPSSTNYAFIGTSSQTYVNAVSSLNLLISDATVGAITSTGLAVTGTLQVSTGAAVGGATPGAGGLAFPATAVAVANANTLDDYEEGTWTPSLGGTTTYSGQTGIYTKIGRMVYIQCYLDILLIGTGSTTTISGLPFAAVNVQGLGMCSYFANLNTNLIAPGFYPSGSTLRNSGLATAADTATNDNAIFKSTTRVDFSCSYMAS